MHHQSYHGNKHVYLMLCVIFTMAHNESTQYAVLFKLFFVLWERCFKKIQYYFVSAELLLKKKDIAQIASKMLYAIFCGYNKL